MTQYDDYLLQLADDHMESFMTDDEYESHKQAQENSRYIGDYYEG